MRVGVRVSVSVRGKARVGVRVVENIFASGGEGSEADARLRQLLNYYNHYS